MLKIVVTDDDEEKEIECGAVEGEIESIEAPVFDDGNDPTLSMAAAVDNDYYTIVLSNPDDSMKDAVGPIVHQMIGNVLGSDLKSGF